MLMQWNKDMAEAGLDFLVIEPYEEKEVDENVVAIKSAFENLKRLGATEEIEELQEWLTGM